MEVTGEAASSNEGNVTDLLEVYDLGGKINLYYSVLYHPNTNNYYRDSTDGSWYEKETL